MRSLRVSGECAYSFLRRLPKAFHKCSKGDKSGENDGPGSLRTAKLSTLFGCVRSCILFSCWKRMELPHVDKNLLAASFGNQGANNKHQLTIVPEPDGAQNHDRGRCSIFGSLFCWPGSVLLSCNEPSSDSHDENAKNVIHLRTLCFSRN